ncbi:KpsF/GutQ family sugar-phosphate isomerase [Photobacterium iliopiscarium]|jgi:arabinose-5-phosphate isomerase|uniref:Arabinose 5-phosphate isomerase n=1 Tax=Photobacterium iliopiscarium TaxID=56192 RepID=A0A2T3MKH6_9GAMM|nr:KpsF/GutQ family sugar-phosphate isomerase [Photobacterium iliopiscarium]MCD9466293.1 D-arabinose 5-phosphate isomerase [Photobacterium iliopiscarium]MCD9486040.1 KpsF/GutQ family sugar-phosphate isomerase [Photobacterium iliopiscarium]MCF2242775.1 KpsF/GutQ family sugar-phosphate isomerase [Photobacterium iliopiscarium]PST93718.1 D-arabinose 5-phosphate isomerase [Photobacterium iliopiscarium]PSV96730.1 D-arabinose 5-phosphate isomerase [Photobacterium iliopiscarium]
MSGQFDFCSHGKKVLDTELHALEKIRDYIDNSFTLACELILHCQGKVIVMGMGKSGHIGRKIAATLASTGTPAFFVHPGEASHGDLGMIKKSDVVIAISNSGEAVEILALLPVIKRLGIAMISMTGKPESSMAKMAQVNLQITVDKEACPLNLAPTSSTTATLVMGDAVAISVMEARGFTADDFALSHPGGALGRKLLLRIADVMHSGELLPMIEEHASIKDALLEISHKGLGMTAIVDHNQQLRGIFTDGDLRRLLDNHIDIHNTSIGEVMSNNPQTISPQLLAAEGLKLMEDNKINGLLVTENNQLVGALNMHDLLKAGVL